MVHPFDNGLHQYVARQVPDRRHRHEGGLDHASLSGNAGPPKAVLAALIWPES
jgi:hypothetical protein